MRRRFSTFGHDSASATSASKTRGWTAEIHSTLRLDDYAAPRVWDATGARIQLVRKRVFRQPFEGRAGSGAPYLDARIAQLCRRPHRSLSLRHRIVDAKKARVRKSSHYGSSISALLSFGSAHAGARRIRGASGRLGVIFANQARPDGRVQAGQALSMPSPMPGCSAGHRHKGVLPSTLRQLVGGGSQWSRHVAIFRFLVSNPHSVRTLN